jgi:hypothetical protein
MKHPRLFNLAIAALLMFSLVSLAPAKDDKKSRPGPLTGTWECVSHGSPQGDMNFTLFLQQEKEVVTGSVSSPIGSADLTTATFKRKVLEIHIDTPQDNYLLNATYKNGALSGDWSTNTGLKGNWEGKKSAETK